MSHITPGYIPTSTCKCWFTSAFWDVPKLVIAIIIYSRLAFLFTINFTFNPLRFLEWLRHFSILNQRRSIARLLCPLVASEFLGTYFGVANMIAHMSFEGMCILDHPRVLGNLWVRYRCMFFIVSNLLVNGA